MDKEKHGSLFISPIDANELVAEHDCERVFLRRLNILTIQNRNEEQQGGQGTQNNSKQEQVLHPFCSGFVLHKQLPRFV
jgi:hypothetical protein